MDHRQNVTIRKTEMSYDFVTYFAFSYECNIKQKKKKTYEFAATLDYNWRKARRSTVTDLGKKLR